MKNPFAGHAQTLVLTFGVAGLTGTVLMAVAWLAAHLLRRVSIDYRA